MNSILIVEDKNNSISYLNEDLEKEGFNVNRIDDIKMPVIKELEKKTYNMVLIDSFNSVNICKQIKQKYNIPVLVFLKETLEKPTCNADEYILKPFNTTQLFSLIQKYLGKKTNGIKYIFKELIFDNDKCEAAVNSEVLVLSKKEYALLLLLVKNKNIILSRDDLLNHVWGIDYLGETNVVDIHIKHLRDKLSKYSELEYIKTIRGVGYSCSEN